MRKITLIRALFALTALNVFVVVGAYLKEKPAFLTPCHIHNAAADKDRCLAIAFENIFANWNDNLKRQGPIDPLRIKKIRISQNVPNVANVRLDLLNVILHGLSKIRFLNTSVNENDYTFRFNIRSPAVKIEDDYKTKGRLLFLDLNGHGKGLINLTDLVLIVTAKTNLKQVDGQYFFDIISISSRILKIGTFNTMFTNLFNGNKELEDSAHALLNGSWRELFEIFRPALTKTLDEIFLDRFKHIFNYTPARFLVEDLP